MAADPNDLTNQAVTVLGGAAGLAWFLRWVVRTFHVDRLMNKTSDAEVGVIDRLQGEITRLEGVINAQKGEVEEMRREQRRMEKRLSNQRAVLIAIETIVESMCTCDNVSRKKLAGLIAELITAEDKEHDGQAVAQQGNQS